MRAMILAAGLLALAVGKADAQAPFVSKPLDTNKLIVQPTDAASGAAAKVSTGTFQTITRTVSGAIENNGFVRTVNNLFGKRAKPVTYQNGYSAIPHAATYASTGYANSFQAAMPINQPYGTSPNVALPTSPSPHR